MYCKIFLLLSHNDISKYILTTKIAIVLSLVSLFSTVTYQEQYAAISLYTTTFGGMRGMKIMDEPLILFLTDNSAAT